MERTSKPYMLWCLTKGCESPLAGYYVKKTKRDISVELQY